MSIDKETMALVDAICDSDMPKARACALAVLDADTAKSRESWRSGRAMRLRCDQTLLSNPVPSDLAGMLVVEDCRALRTGRYVLGRRELAALDHVRRIRATTSTLQAMGIRYPVSLLLYGEPGVGKTMLARHIAYSHELPLVYVSFSSLVDSYMGATSRHIARIFQFASTYPCVLVLDEVDTIAVTRDGSSGADKELARVSVTLMQELDRIPSTMMLVACTNRPDAIDPALMRRFTKRVELVRPQDWDEVRTIASRFLDDCGQAYSSADLTQLTSRPTTYPTQSQIVNALTEDIAAHVFDGGTSDENLELSNFHALVWSKDSIRDFRQQTIIPEEYTHLTVDSMTVESPTSAMYSTLGELRILARDMYQQIKDDDATFRDLRERGYVDEDYDGALGAEDRAPAFESRMEALGVARVECSDEDQIKEDE